jgi:hypothetical protein
MLATKVDHGRSFGRMAEIPITEMALARWTGWRSRGGGDPTHRQEITRREVLRIERKRPSFNVGVPHF